MQLTTLLLLTSALLQLAAVVLAVRLFDWRRMRVLAIWLCLTLTLMFLRRVLSLVESAVGPLGPITRGLPSEATALTISVILCGAIWQLRESFAQWSRSESLLEFQRDLLEHLARHEPLQHTLENVIRRSEAREPGMIGSILVLDPDGVHLRHGAAPNLPEAYTRQVDGVAIGPAVGSCGTATYLRRRVIVEDIAVDPLWAPYRELALQHQLRACWSEPVIGSTGEVLGSFAMYYRAPRKPRAEEIRLIETAARLTALAIERERTKSALQRSESRLGAMIASTMDGIIMMDEDQRLVLVNPAAERVFQRSAAELLGSPIESLMPSRFRPGHRARVMAFAESMMPTMNLVRPGGIWGIRANGEEFPIEASVSQIHEGPARLFTIIFRDITERLRTQAALIESQRAMSTLLANLPGLVYRCQNTPEWPVEFISDGAFEVTGYPASEFIAGRVHFGNIIDAEDAPRVWEQVQEALAARRAFALTYRITRANGDRTWVREQGQGVFDDQGSLLALEGFITDITEQRDAEERLRESEARLRTILENEPECVKILDPDGRLLEMNPAGLAMIEADTLDQVRGKDVVELALPEYREAFRRLNASIVQGSTGRLEFECVGLKGSRRWLETHGVPMRDSAGHVTALLGVTRDITARRQAELELREAHAQLERRVRERTAELAAANQDLEAFTYSVSHDLRAPVRHVGSFARILMDEHAANLSADAKHCAETIAASAAKLGRLIDDLLRFARLGRAQLHRGPLDMRRLATEVWEELRESRSVERVRLEIRDLPEARGDPNLLRHVWTNLIDNAIKYSSTRPRPEIRIEAFAEAGQIWYSVSDNGVGFDPRYADRLFGVFQRLHREEDFPGAGVGLALVQRIIQRHGGFVRASGALDQGARFEFTLGRCQDDPSARTPPD